MIKSEHCSKTGNPFKFRRKVIKNCEWFTLRVSNLTTHTSQSGLVRSKINSNVDINFMINILTKKKLRFALLISKKNRRRLILLQYVNLAFYSVRHHVCVKESGYFWKIFYKNS